MRIVVFGLSISSAWGNGHATLLRGLFRALHDAGHEIDFFERDTPYYAAHRDAAGFPFAHLHLYSDWAGILPAARKALSNADAGVVTSYCPDGVAACELVLGSGIARTVFYDMDTPVTLSRLDRGEAVPYVPSDGLAGFDVVLSYTGGPALDRLRERLGARRVSPLYGWVDPGVYRRVPACERFRGQLSYLGTYSADRQAAFEQLLLAPARKLPAYAFVVGGAMYPRPERWPPNVRHSPHVAPPEHAAFYSSSPVTLNITRASMAEMGFCPSGRLFEAAACGTAVMSDWWTGLDTFFRPGEEILIATGASDAIGIMGKSPAEFERVGARARERALDCHTAAVRAREFVTLVEAAVPEHASA